VAFGSWARSEEREESDVDVLVVLEPSTKITRALYRGWDSDPVEWESRQVEPHLVHLPEEGARITGLWAEVAVEGIVLFDRDLSVSKRLVDIRREIAAGRMVRREAHGQPYWVGVA
jgi:predicted nucleotidyltransferase